MPKFFFNFRTRNGLSRDEEGTEFPTLEKAREAALTSVRELVCDNVKSASKDPLEAVIVTDESGRELMTILAENVIPQLQR